MSLRFAQKHIPWIVGAAVCAAVAAVYLTTVQTDINGLDDLVDVGEFQNALFLWGIAHPTGYPLYLLVGGVFVHLVNLAGINPAAGASLFSLTGAMATLALFFAAIVLQTGRTLLAAAFTLVLGAVGAFWMRSIDAEVYTWAFFFVALAFALALIFRARPSAALFLGFLFAFGTGIAHHRLVALMFPAALVWIAPEAWNLLRANRRLAVLGVAALVLPFAVYVYLPLRSHFGTVWQFAPADTWSGFWGLFTGRGYLDATIAIPTNGASLASRLVAVLNQIFAQLTLVGFAATALCGLVLCTSPSTRRLAAFVTIGFSTFLLFAVIYPIRDIDAYLVPATMLLLFSAAAAAGEWSKNHSYISVLASAFALCLAAYLGLATFPGAYQVGSDRSGRELLDAVKPLSSAQTLLVGPWGPDFFDFWYGKYVTREIPQSQVATPDAPIHRYINQGLRVYASRDIFYSVPLKDWDRKLGQTYLTSAGEHVVQISNKPIKNPELESTGGEATFGSVVTLVKDETAFDPIRRVLNVTIFWRAEERIDKDYSVMVHLVDRKDNDRVIAQADSVHPVYGFYPTSRWQKGEIVRDDYAVSIVRDVPLDQADLLIGWYRSEPASSGFVNLGSFRVSTPALKRGR